MCCERARTRDRSGEVEYAFAFDRGDAALPSALPETYDGAFYSIRWGRVMLN